jgi:hypothetical protein
MLLVLGMTVVFFVGAITVDVGLWLSEKSGAQTDADFPALAGAWELLPQNGNAASAGVAVDDSLADNDETGNLSLLNATVDDSCFNGGTDDAVTVEVEHESVPLFISIFGIVDDPEIEARAKACAGAATGLTGVVPFQVDDNPGPCFTSQEDPIFTSFCPIELGAQGGNPRGMLDLQAQGDYCSNSSGSGNIENMIEWGAPGNCFINSTGDCDPNHGGPWYDCVAVQTGNPANVLDGVFSRVSRDGDCDDAYGDGDGLDEFNETIELVAGSGATGLYEARDCDTNTDGKQVSPRLVTIVVLEDPPSPGNSGYEIEAFAGFYLAGCSPEGVVVTDQSQLDTECDRSSTMDTSGSAEAYVTAPVPGFLAAPAACHRGNPHGLQTSCATPTPTTPPGPTPAPTPPPGGTGHSVVWGQFVKLVVADHGGVGAPTDQTTIFGINLVE